MRNYYLSFIVAAMFLACTQNRDENLPTTRSKYEKLVSSIEYTDTETGEVSMDEFRYSDKGMLIGYGYRSSSETADISRLEYADNMITIPDKSGTQATSQLQYILDEKGVCERYVYKDGMRPTSATEVVYGYENGRLSECTLSDGNTDLCGKFTWTEGNLTRAEYDDGSGKCLIELSYGTSSNVSSTNIDLNWAVTGYVSGGSLLLPFVSKPWGPMLRLCKESSSAALVSKIVETRGQRQTLAADIIWETDSKGVPESATVVLNGAVSSKTKLRFVFE